MKKKLTDIFVHYNDETAAEHKLSDHELRNYHGCNLHQGGIFTVASFNIDVYISLTDETHWRAYEGVI